MAKKLPIGIQTITEILNNGYVYVDKTDLALSLIESGNYFFMSRPRRFGKSLFISTLKEILLGNQELFQGCYIVSSSYIWKEYPVLHIDFSSMPLKSTEEFEIALQETLGRIANEYKVTLHGSSIQLQLSDLVQQLSLKNKVVVLIDEYDKPIIDNLLNNEVAEGNREVLKSFFGTIKSLDPYLRFTFITGVSKFSQVSLFSGLNNLRDITTDPQYATLMGYTTQEIDRYLYEHIELIQAKRQLENTQMIYKELKEWYNGYSFSREGIPVFNPHSTLNYLNSGHVESYWFSTGTPSFLIEQIRKHPIKATKLSGSFAKRMELLDIFDFQDIDLKALMWQCGYLTFKGYNSKADLYLLDFPNREVRLAFFDSLLREFAKVQPSDVSLNANKTKANFEACDFEAFFNRMNAFYANIPYNLFIQAKEGFYHAVFLSLLEGMGITTRAEDPTCLGRIDLVVDTPKLTYIFEMKVDKSAAIALEQIDIKNYCTKYLHKDKKLVVLGVNFDTSTRNISEWVAKIYEDNGTHTETLSSEQKEPLTTL